VQHTFRIIGLLELYVVSYRNTLEDCSRTILYVFLAIMQISGPGFIPMEFHRKIV